MLIDLESLTFTEGQVIVESGQAVDGLYFIV